MQKYLVVLFVLSSAVGALYATFSHVAGQGAQAEDAMRFAQLMGIWAVLAVVLARD